MRRPNVTDAEKKAFYAACDAIRDEEPKLSVRAYAYRIGGLAIYDPETGAAIDGIRLHGVICEKEGPAPGKPPVNEETIQRLVLAGRRNGRLPYESIIDGTRPTHYAGEGWDTREQAAAYVANARQSTIDNYSLSIWYPQGKHVEFLSEKEALEPIVSRVTDAYEVNLTSNKGFASESMLYRVAREVASLGVPTTFLVLTDHDRPGYNMFEHVEKVMRRLVRLVCKQTNRRMPVLRFKRVGLTAEQVARYEVSTRAAKSTEKASWRNHVADCAEVDWLRSWQIEEIVREGIEAQLGLDLLAATRAQEAADIEWLRENL
jgi:hypothetical protein